MNHEATWTGRPGDVVVRLPDGPVRAALVALHGASDGRARQPLFEHLGHVLGDLGVAVVSYPRPSVPGGDDTPLTVQATDAISAVAATRAELDVPTGLFGFSQGAWAATLAAAHPSVEFLVVLGCSGVSPAAQMRYYTDELLRRHGYDDSARRELQALRLALEALLRSPDEARRRAVDTRLGAASHLPWFRHAYLPSGLAEPLLWSDMDFDPAPTFSDVVVPVLAMWGEDEECVPRPESQHAWRSSGADVTIVDLPGCGHWPARGSAQPGFAGRTTDPDFPISPDFDAALTRWLAGRVLS